jgi:hypothetical protein
LLRASDAFHRGNYISCGAYTLDRRCNAGTQAAAYSRVYGAFNPPDSALVKKEVVLLRKGEHVASVAFACHSHPASS